MSSTAELRWWFDGAAPASLATWFTDHVADEAERSDRYLRLPGTDALGVKLRGGSGALELKLRTAHEPVSGLPAGAAGRLERWQKWSLPRRPWGLLLPRLALPRRSWSDVPKRRRTATFAWAPQSGATLTTVAPAVGCRAELATVTPAGDTPWSTLGLEAFGPEDLLRPVLLATAEALLAAAGPVDGLTLDRSHGYPAWLDHVAGV